MLTGPERSRSARAVAKSAKDDNCPSLKAMTPLPSPLSNPGTRKPAEGLREGGACPAMKRPYRGHGAAISATDPAWRKPRPPTSRRTGSSARPAAPRPRRGAL
ncbi:hypothetical protein GCM10010495_49020 [Kitasatospora herbaricolor]|nr:hypothetical protein GCM10010495_49020 [Kitasatospora herbaricolor]